MTLHQFSMDRGFDPGGEKSVELSYTLETSEDKEIISFSDIVTFSDKAEDSFVVTT